MSKSAQQRFNEMLAESDRVASAIRAFNNRSYEKRNTYAYAVGTLTTIAQDAIAMLPKAKRQQFIDLLNRLEH
jgi:hypothetical protein